MADEDHDELSKTADRILQEALDASGAGDPRTFYRERLRELKDADRTRYDEAVTYYRDTLIPGVASGRLPPLAAWTEYGRRLAASLAPGRTVVIDPSGRASPYAEPAPPDALVLHLPEQKGGRALFVGRPPELSLAQQATFEVLVAGKQRLRD